MEFKAPSATKQARPCDSYRLILLIAAKKASFFRRSVIVTPWFHGILRRICSYPEFKKSPVRSLKAQIFLMEAHKVPRDCLNPRGTTN